VQKGPTVATSTANCSESTQPDRDKAHYRAQLDRDKAHHRATGLTAAYLDGALLRALTPQPELPPLTDARPLEALSVDQLRNIVRDYDMTADEPVVIDRMTEGELIGTIMLNAERGG
jgi:hypothetical protein